MYKCQICGKEFKLFPKHLNSHKISFSEYFEKFPNEVKIFKDYDNTQKLSRKQNSPNSIEYYLKRYDISTANQKLEEHRKKIINTNIAHALKKSNINYWVSSGLSREESILKVAEYKINVREKEINNVIFNASDDISRDDALTIIKDKKKAVTPTRIDYWISKGHTPEEAKLKVSEHQKSVSPRSELYWIKKGYAPEIAKIKVSEYQDFSSITYIMYKHKCNEEEALLIQKEIKTRELNTKQDRGLMVDISEKLDFANYRKLVEKETEKNYKIFKNIINPFGYNRSTSSFHLDHIYSVLHGYLNNIDYKIIASHHNLRVVLYNENLSKNSKSDITIEELLKKINNNI